MDPNLILCWLVGLGSVGNTAALFILQRFRAPSWYFVYGVNAALLTAGLVFAPDIAGYATAPIFALTVIAPAWLVRLANAAAHRSRHALTHRLLQLAGILHPFGLFADQVRLFEASALVDRGDFEEARAALRALAERGGPAADYARIHAMRLDDDFSGMRDFIEQDLVRLRNPVLAAVYVRALGETGAITEMLAVAREQHGLPVEPWANVRLVVGAFTGRSQIVDAMLDGPLRAYPVDVKAYWRGTAALAAGDEALARSAFASAGVGPAVRRAIDHRLARGVVRPALTDEQHARLDQMERDAIADRDAFIREHGVLRFASVTTAFVVVNLAMFAVELPGGALDTENLIRLGALVLPLESWRDAWRLLSACFLHFGWLHVVMNVIALVVFGAALERMLGRWRFFVLYLGAGVGSMGAYALFHAWMQDSGSTLAQADVLVGASGCVMGIIGGLLGATIGEWLQTRRAHLLQRIGLFAVIFGAQALFDLFTPRIAMAAHVSGAVIGVLFAFALRPRRRSSPDSGSPSDRGRASTAA